MTASWAARVVASSRVGAHYLPLLKELEAPVVLLNNQHPSEFAYSVTIDNRDGGYQALKTSGAHAENVLAFSRRDANRTLVVVCGRLLLTLLQKPDRLPLGDEVWADTFIESPLPGKKLVRRLEQLRTPAGRADEQLQRLAHGNVVVDDEHDRYLLRHRCRPCPIARCSRHCMCEHRNYSSWRSRGKV